MNILLIDDHKLIVEGLKNSLIGKLSGSTISTITDFQKTDIMNTVKDYDLILLDINLNKIGTIDGLTLGKEILKKYSDKKICFLTGFDLPGYENEARKIGAKGFISKEVGISDLVRKIEAILEGQTVFSKNKVWMEDLTPKEEEILQLYCQGYKRKEIANKLEISIRTLANHLNSIYEKLDVSNYQEMVQKAIRLGYMLPKKD